MQPPSQEELLNKIRELLSKAGPMNSNGTVVDTGNLQAINGKVVPYELKLGWDIATASVCDDTWGVFNIRLARFIRDQNYDDEKLNDVLSQIQIDDSHWRWLNKSLKYTEEEFKWFFLIAESYPQAACLIYHPKPSAIDGQGIFYIEFVAVAPWNRQNPMQEKSFSGLGTLIVGKVREYAIQELKLHPGFCLHALPRAAGFYHSIGMQRFEHMDKPSLQYFEMPG